MGCKTQPATLSQTAFRIIGPTCRWYGQRISSNVPIRTFESRLMRQWNFQGYPNAIPMSALKAREPSTQRFVKRSARTPSELAQQLIASSQPGDAQNAARRQKAEEDLKRLALIRDLNSQNHRFWRPGDLYSPHDLSPTEMQKWRNKNQGARDVFDMLGINPLHEYKNVAILNDFLTPLGRIKHRRETGLRPVNQRRISKAIRRAVAMGLIPSVHRHPEIIEVEVKQRNMSS